MKTHLLRGKVDTIFEEFGNGMFFAVLGRDQDRARLELMLFGADIQSVEKGIAYFTLDSLLQHEWANFSLHLGGSTKWGVCVAWDDLGELLEGVDLIGISDRKLGMRCKKEFGVKRFKTIDYQSTDREIRENGLALLDIGEEGALGVVTGYQDIPRFEAIDFDKPMRSMQTGMMPAKLTQTLVNIGVGAIQDLSDKPTVYDPFCGFGTTGFVANSCNYNFLGSDKNPTPTKQNFSRWKETQRYTKGHFKIFKHDVTDQFTQPFVEYADCVVSEGWLGPMISDGAVKQLSDSEFTERRQDITNVYAGFLSNINKVLPEVPIVITYPQWTFIDENMSEGFVEQAETLGYGVRQIGDIYKRKGQNVARRVLLLQKG